MTSSQLRGRCWTSSTWNSPATCSAAPTWPTMRACSPTAAGGSASAFTSKVCEWLLVFNLKKGSIITSNCCFFPQYFLCPYKYQYASRIPYFFFTLLLFYCSGKPWKFGILYRSLNDSEIPYTYQVPIIF